MCGQCQGVCVCVCVPESAGRCQGQLEREFYQFNLNVREKLCVCEGGPGEMKEGTFFFLSWRLIFTTWRPEAERRRRTERVRLKGRDERSEEQRREEGRHPRNKKRRTLKEGAKKSETRYSFNTGLWIHCNNMATLDQWKGASDGCTGGTGSFPSITTSALVTRSSKHNCSWVGSRSEIILQQQQQLLSGCLGRCMRRGGTTHTFCPKCRENRVKVTLCNTK